MQTEPQNLSPRIFWLPASVIIFWSSHINCWSEFSTILIDGLISWNIHCKSVPKLPPCAITEMTKQLRIFLVSVFEIIFIIVRKKRWKFENVFFHQKSTVDFDQKIFSVAQSVIFVNRAITSSAVPIRIARGKYEIFDAVQNISERKTTRIKKNGCTSISAYSTSEVVGLSMKSLPFRTLARIKLSLCLKTFLSRALFR